MEGLIAVMLIFSLFTGSPAAVDSDQPDIQSQTEAGQVIKEVRNSAGEIIMSKENVTTATQLLASLPPRKEKINIAIYGIRKKTGQYDEKGAPVDTQGAAEMLITA